MFFKILRFFTDHYKKFLIFLLCILLLSGVWIKLIYNLLYFLANKLSLKAQKIYITPTTISSFTILKELYPQSNNDLYESQSIKSNNQYISIMIKDDFIMPNMMDLDIATIQKNIKQINIVKDCCIIRKFPNSIYFYILERTPVAIWNYNNKEFLIDIDGFIIEKFNKQDIRDNLIQLTGNNAPLFLIELYKIMKYNHNIVNNIKSIDCNQVNINIKFNKNISIPSYQFNNKISIKENIKNLIDTIHTNTK